MGALVIGLRIELESLTYVALNGSIGSDFARGIVRGIESVHIRAAHIIFLLPAVQNKTIVFSEVGRAIAIVYSRS